MTSSTPPPAEDGSAAGGQGSGASDPRVAGTINAARGRVDAAAVAGDGAAARAGAAEAGAACDIDAVDGAVGIDGADHIDGANHIEGVDHIDGVDRVVGADGVADADERSVLPERKAADTPAFAGDAGGGRRAGGGVDGSPAGGRRPADAPTLSLRRAGAGDAVAADAAGSPDVAATGRKRPKPGERRVQILQTLARMLEQPGAERVTTAALAAQLKVSEAALYRHFASKAQMFEGLIEFIEHSVFSLINQIAASDDDGALQTRKILAVVLQFGEKNPGMTRVMVGDALVFENERLLARMNQFFDRIESQLRQSLRAAAEASATPTPTVDAQARAAALTAFLVGRLHRYARSGFKRSPVEHLDASIAVFTRSGAA